MEKKHELVHKALDNVLLPDLVEYVLIPYMSPKCTQCLHFLTEEELTSLQKKKVTFLLCNACQQTCIVVECRWMGPPQEFVNGFCPYHHPNRHINFFYCIDCRRPFLSRHWADDAAIPPSCLDCVKRIEDEEYKKNSFDCIQCGDMLRRGINPRQKNAVRARRKGLSTVFVKIYVLRQSFGGR